MFHASIFGGQRIAGRAVTPPDGWADWKWQRITHNSAVFEGRLSRRVGRGGREGSVRGEPAGCAVTVAMHGSGSTR